MDFLGRLRRTRRRTRLLALGAAAVLAAGAAVGVPLATAEGGDPGSRCRPAPAEARALARDPARATAALDPGADMGRIRSLARLLRTSGHPLCPDTAGTGAAGRAVVAAATGRAAGDAHAPRRAHREAEARVLYGVALLLSEARHSERLPDGLAPYVAEALAAYIDDVRRAVRGAEDIDYRKPTRRPSRSDLVELRLGALTYGDEPHVAFGPFPGAEHTPYDRHGPNVSRLIRRLTPSPRAFATLYDAERAYFASYLEHLDDTARIPGARTDDGRLDGTESEVRYTADLLGTLSRARENAVREGVISDPEAYDRAVLHHSRGVHRARDRQVRTRQPAVTLAQRRPSAPAGKGARAAERLLDGRIQMFGALDDWADARGIPDSSREQLRLGALRAYLSA